MPGIATKKAPAPAPICRGEYYTKEELMQRAKWKRQAWTTACRQGLKRVMQGGTMFVSGDAFHDFLAERAKAAADKASQG